MNSCLKYAVKISDCTKYDEMHICSTYVRIYMVEKCFLVCSCIEGEQMSDRKEKYLDVTASKGMNEKVA
jgi:hypothetical protein